MDIIYKEQVGHLAQIGEIVYARFIEELTKTTVSKR